ncbi:class I SAM-dependent methyltransferase [Legionella tunisiensis]|uniref:class I SAM-dependent methyltransferase n=1 Tax=Legionella tunisiensis TaxID=1034944 RepID=UPI00030F8C3B|nr:class I SAM-dependent methyltransferase [Legionella tunisiensis]
MQVETLNKETTRESYQTTAVAFARNVAELAPTGSIEKFINFLPPNAKIIDIGCGAGRDAKLFSAVGAEVLGIDFSSNLIDIAQQYAPLAQFQVMDMETMSFPETSFDGAWAACSLGHLPKKSLPAVLKKIHSLLAEQGYFYLALKKGHGEMLENDARYGSDVKKFWSYYEEEELKDRLQEAHFEIIDFATVAINHHYQTHPAIRVFCRKLT